MKLLAAAFLLSSILFLAIPTYAQSADRDGNALLKSCNAALKRGDDSSAQVDRGDVWYCIGYVQGIREALDAQRALSSSMHIEDSSGILIPEEVPVGQIIRVLVKWLHDHPENLHEPKIVIMILSLREAFPVGQVSVKQ